MKAGDARPPLLGIIGGSGLYDLEGLEDLTEARITTPFGPPSGPLVVGRLGEQPVAFLARHGRGHRLLPSEINYRANIHAMKQVGARWVVSISAVGSLRAGLAPGDFVLVDQYVDKTHGRRSTFFGGGVVGHVSFAEPVCGALSAHVAAVAETIGFVAGSDAERDEEPTPGRKARVYRGGTYVCMEGPQFSTRAESLLHRSMGADVIGMTGATEAKLAREAELCFAAVALATDYDCWHSDHDAVTTTDVLRVLGENIAHAKALVKKLAPSVSASTPAGACSCGSASAHAILTAKEAVTEEARARLSFILGRYL